MFYMVSDLELSLPIELWIGKIVRRWDRQILMHLYCPKKDSKKKIQPQCLLRRERQIKEIQHLVVYFVGNIIQGEC